MQQLCQKKKIGFLNKMKKILEKIVIMLPYFILILITGFLFVFYFKNTPDFQQLIQLLQTLIWPIIVLLGLLFFKKVFTYLFLSMEEFNFFGNRGKLKDIRDIIEEKVEKRIKEEKEQENRKIESAKFTAELEKVKKSKSNSDKKIEETENLTKKIFKMYQDLSKNHDIALNELNEFRKRQAERDARMAAIRERIKLRTITENDNVNEMNSAPKADKSEEPKNTQKIK